MKVSIITSCFNREATIGQAIESVLAQDYSDIEYIVVDGASRDNSLQVINRYKDRIARIISEPDRGMYEGINKGIRAATGDVVGLLHSDDFLYSPHTVSHIVEEFERTGADFVYSDEIVLSADLKQLGGYHFKPDFAPDYLRGVNFITHLAVFSRPLLDAAGAYESREYDGAQDHDLFLRLTEKARKIEHIKQVLYIWRGHAGSTAAGIVTDGINGFLVQDTPDSLSTKIFHLMLHPDEVRRAGEEARRTLARPWRSIVQGEVLDRYLSLIRRHQAAQGREGKCFTAPPSPLPGERGVVSSVCRSTHLQDMLSPPLPGERGGGVR